jgi:hypothetical protein
MSSTTLSPYSGQPIPAGQIGRNSLLAIGLSIVANLILYYLALAVAPSVGEFSMLGPINVVASTVVYLLFAILAFILVNRFSSTPVRTYRIVAAIALLLSLLPPISAGLGGIPNIPPASPATVITFILMHLTSAAITIWALTVRK